MKSIEVFRFGLLAIVAGLCLAGCVASKKIILTDADQGTFSFPSDNSYWNGRKIDLIGTLDFPETDASPYPAMIIFHGSGVQGYRDKSWSQFFLENGIATFRVDYFTPRGIRTSDYGGPMSSYDVLGALKFLATHLRIDRNRIGLIGFSRGGGMVMGALRLDTRDTGGVQPAAYIGLYPGCQLTYIDRYVPDVPILFVSGDSDDYIPATACLDREAEGKRYGKDVRAVILPGGEHGFDGDTSAYFYYGGARVEMAPDRKLTEIARKEVLATLKRAFKM